MSADRLRRVTDLFVEGTELDLGVDEAGKPVVIWVNKLNSFEVEEARRDAVVKRGIRIGELARPESPELVAVNVTLAGWDMDELANARLSQMSEELYLKALNDVEVDPEMREIVDRVRRGAELLDDNDAPDDDPRRVALEEANQKYLDAVQNAAQDVNDKALRDLKVLDRDELERDFIEGWRNRISLEVFIEERRVTELYYALRDCRATKRTDGKFDHDDCNHAERLLDGRKDVRSLPEGVIEKAVDILDGVTVPVREAGNSDAPTSSSASSGQPSVPEESTPSIPVEKSPEPATT